MWRTSCGDSKCVAARGQPELPPPQGTFLEAELGWHPPVSSPSPMSGGPPLTVLEGASQGPGSPPVPPASRHRLAVLPLDWTPHLLLSPGDHGLSYRPRTLKPCLLLHSRLPSTVTRQQWCLGVRSGGGAPSSCTSLVRPLTATRWVFSSG